jgi:hypothetical protein
MHKFRGAPLIVAAILFFSISPTTTGAAETYSTGVQSEVRWLLSEMAETKLPAVLSQYEQLRQRPTSRGPVFAALHVGASDSEAYETRTRAIPLLPFRIEDGEIILRDGGHLIELGPDQYLRRSLLIDGQEFRWEKSESFARNVNRMSALLQGGRAHASLDALRAYWQMPWDLLVPSAQADNIYDIQVPIGAAGYSKIGSSVIHLFMAEAFVAKQGSESELKDLNERMQSETESCQSGQSAQKVAQKVIFAANDAKMAQDGFLKIPGLTDDKKLKNRVYEVSDCKGFEEYTATLPSHTAAANPTGKQVVTIERTRPNPPAICKTLSQLQSCIQDQYDKGKLVEANVGTFKGTSVPSEGGSAPQPEVPAGAAPAGLGVGQGLH